MVKLKTQEQIETMREGGRILATFLKTLSSEVKAGVKVEYINKITNELCTQYDVIPVFLNYTPYGAPRAYPGSICVSINDEVVHGIPNEGERVFKDGDVVALDMGISYKGLIVDSAITVGCGEVDENAKRLMKITKQALDVGINAAQVGKKTGDIGHAIEQFVKKNGRYGIPEELGGHGVGLAVHEDPFVPNFGKKGQGVKLVPGMTIAIEPMLNEGSKKIFLEKDGYTLKTIDGKRSAHFEHTVAITEEGAVILTEV